MSIQFPPISPKLWYGGGTVADFLEDGNLDLGGNGFKGQAKRKPLLGGCSTFFFRCSTPSELFSCPPDFLWKNARIVNIFPIADSSFRRPENRGGKKFFLFSRQKLLD
jgi:hypothetical protein